MEPLLLRARGSSKEGQQGPQHLTSYWMLAKLLDATEQLTWRAGVFTCAVLLLVLCVRAYLRFFYHPRMLIRNLRRQGIQGQPFKAFVGEMQHVTNSGQDVATTEGNLWQYLCRWREQYGKVFFYCYGSEVRLTIVDPALASAVFHATTGNQGYYKKKDLTAEVLQPVMGKNGLVFASNATWPRQRKLVSPMFSSCKLKEVERFAIQSAQELTSRWEQRIAESGGRAEIEVSQELNTLALDVVCRSVFGDETRGASAYSGEDIYRELSTLLKDITVRGFGIWGLLVPGYKYLPLPLNFRIARNSERLRTMILSLIANRRAKAASEAETSGKPPNFGSDLLGSLLAASDEEGSLSTQELIDQCKTFFFAGHDTSGLAITWALLLLSQHPTWQERARAEVLETCGDKIPEGGALCKLKVVTMVLLETLRLFPPVVYVGRDICKPHQLGPYTIPATSSLSISLPIYLLHRDKAIWGGDAEEFNPERFADGIKDRRAYLPFTAGPRNCLGQQFAMLETKLVLATLLQKFSFSVAPGYRHHPHSTVTLRPKYGLPLLVERVMP